MDYEFDADYWFEMLHEILRYGDAHDLSVVYQFALHLIRPHD